MSKDLKCGGVSSCCDIGCECRDCEDCVKDCEESTKPRRFIQLCSNCATPHEEYFWILYVGEKDYRFCSQSCFEKWASDVRVYKKLNYYKGFYLE